MAHIWPLFGVNSQVIIEIMPFSEHFVAVLVCATQKANDFAREGISVLEY